MMELESNGGNGSSRDRSPSPTHAGQQQQPASSVTASSKLQVPPLPGTQLGLQHWLQQQQQQIQFQQQMSLSTPDMGRPQIPFQPSAVAPLPQAAVFWDFEVSV